MLLLFSKCSIPRADVLFQQKEDVFPHVDASLYKDVATFGHPDASIPRAQHDGYMIPSPLFEL